MHYSRTNSGNIIRFGGQTRRLMSRRTLLGLVIGVLLGFNLGTWFSLPLNTGRTDIAIRVIQGEQGNGFKLGSAHIRHDDAKRPCKKSIYDEEDEIQRNQRRQREEEEAEAMMPPDFNLEEEKARRQKELEHFYESDDVLEEDDPDGEVEQLEDFQYPVNFNPDKFYETDDFVGKPVVVENEVETYADVEPFQEDAPVTDRKHFLYIGVLTAGKYLGTRGQALMDTWGRSVPGKLEFYVGEDANLPPSENMNIVRIPTVKDNIYPPQKKSFLLLKTMHDEYLHSG